MSDETERRRIPGRQAGCSGCGCVVVGGFLLTFLGAAIGGGLSARVPFTEANVSIAGSVGRKDLSRIALPAYVRNTVGSNQNFINQTQSLTIGPAEGIQLFVVGNQPGAPTLDLNLSVQQSHPE